MRRCRHRPGWNRTPSSSVAFRVHDQEGSRARPHGDPRSHRPRHLRTAEPSIARGVSRRGLAARDSDPHPAHHLGQLLAQRSAARSSTPRNRGAAITHSGSPNRFYADLLRRGRIDGAGGLSAKTVRYVHSILRKALADAVRWNTAQRNVADLADPPKLTGQHREMRTWTAEQLRAFLEHIAEERLYAAFLLAATTGLRRGEVLGLRWADVDLEAARISVRQSLVLVAYEPKFSEPKTNRSRRSVALDGRTVATLRSWRKQQLEERMLLGVGYDDSELVFTRDDGRFVHPDRFSQLFDKYVAVSELPRIRLHDLRHTHATLALAAGVHPKVVSERLGHSTVAFTLDVYSHAVPALQEEAAERIAAHVFGS